MAYDGKQSLISCANFVGLVDVDHHMVPMPLETLNICGFVWPILPSLALWSFIFYTARPLEMQ